VNTSALKRVLESRKVWIAIVAAFVVIATQLGLSEAKAAIIGGAVLKLAFTLIGAIAVEDGLHKVGGNFADDRDLINADRIAKLLTERAVRAEDPEWGGQQPVRRSVDLKSISTGAGVAVLLAVLTAAAAVLCSGCASAPSSPRNRSLRGQVQLQRGVVAVPGDRRRPGRRPAGDLRHRALPQERRRAARPARSPRAVGATPPADLLQHGHEDDRGLRALPFAIQPPAPAKEIPHGGPSTRPAAAGTRLLIRPWQALQARVAAADARAVGRTRCPDPRDQRASGCGGGESAGPGPRRLRASAPG
jgi:hypothetical protein